MGFLGPVARLGDTLVRPHDLRVHAEPRDGALEAQVARVVHLGFEVRVELELDGGEPLSAQLTRDEAAELELRGGRHRVGAPARARRGERADARGLTAARQRVTHASGSLASVATCSGSAPAAMSASVTCSATERRLARTAIQTF